MAWILNSVTDGKGGGAGIKQWKKMKLWMAGEKKRNCFNFYKETIV